MIHPQKIVDAEQFTNFVAALRGRTGAIVIAGRYTPAQLVEQAHGLVLDLGSRISGSREINPRLVRALDDAMARYQRRIALMISRGNA